MPEKNSNHFPDRDINDINTMPNEKTAGQGSRIHSREVLQTYCFEFCGEKNYTAFFEGKLTKDDIHNMLEVLHSCLYEECPESVRSYLEQQHMEYFHFKAEASLPNHAEVMGRAGMLLNSDSCSEIDSRICRADNYYAVADYQKKVNGGDCEGCYYAVQKTTGHENCHYRIIGQTFAADKNDDSFKGYFAIRTDDRDSNLHNADSLSTEPVLPLFGCVDMIAVLMDIDSLSTAEQVIKTAVK